MSEVYFRKLFKKEFNTSPKKYVIDSRIKHAVSLINSGLYTLKEIASLCGYTDYKYFSVEFKKMTGKSPSEYTYSFKCRKTTATPSFPYLFPVITLYQNGSPINRTAINLLHFCKLFFFLFFKLAVRNLAH